MNNKNRILLLGSGLMAQTVISYLVSKSNQIHIASNIIADAQKLANKYSASCTFSQVDVQNPNSLGPLVEKADIVISYIPAFLHIHVARICLKFEKNLVTASYVTKEMKELHQQVKNKGLIFLNEMGLDPGIDHMSAMKVINQIHEKDGKIIEFESWCGGLPSPQFCDNPLGYRFTWSPIGALRAVNNQAKYIFNKKQYTVLKEDLLYDPVTVNINAALQLQGYPNRDSTNYQQLYHLFQTQKILRGTLRYRGFCTLINAFKELKFMTQEIIKGKNWIEYLNIILQNELENDNYDKGLVQENLVLLTNKIINRSVQSIKNYKKLSNQQKYSKANQIIKGLRFFGFFDPQNEFQKPTLSILENLVILLNKKLKLNAGEADLIVMQHRFKIQFPKEKPYTRTSSLILIGQKKGFSGMSITVGFPTAIATQMILDKKFNSKGVVIPLQKQIYEGVLQELKNVGIVVKEQIQ